MRTALVATISALGSLLLAVPALAALDQPSRVSQSFQVQTTFGACDVGGNAETSPAPAGVGQLRSGSWIDCGGWSATPYSEWVSVEISGLGLTEQLNGPYRKDILCRAQRRCSLLHSRSLLPPGDYQVAYRFELDVATGTGSQTYFTSYPSECTVNKGDTTQLSCAFTQQLTYLP